MNSEQADILDLLSGHTDDTTIERLAFECLLTNMTDDRVVSLMNILGWQGDFNCFAIGGVPSASLASTSLAIRKAVRDLGGEHVVIGTYGTFLLALACQMGAVTPEVTCTAVMPAFSEDEPRCVRRCSRCRRLRRCPLLPVRCVPTSCCRSVRCWVMITRVRNCIGTYIRCCAARIPMIPLI